MDVGEDVCVLAGHLVEVAIEGLEVVVEVLGPAPGALDPTRVVLEDGRVLLCEDASQYNRTYPNDGLRVYEPDDGERDRGHGSDDGDDGDDPGRGRARGRR